MNSSYITSGPDICLICETKEDLLNFKYGKSDLLVKENPEFTKACCM